jgi:hypothetical protein
MVPEVIYPYRWQREWFFLWNDADAPLLVFTGNRPIPQPNWGYGVARRDTHKLQPLRDIVRQLLQAELTEPLLAAAFSRSGGGQ